MSARYTKGFTLMELVIVLGIIVGLSSVLLLQGTEGKDRTRVTRAAVQLEAALKEAQALGNSGRAFPVGASAPDNFDRGYGVQVTEGSGTFFIYGGQGNVDGSVDASGNPTIDPTEEVYVAGNEYETIIFEGGVVVDNVDFSSGGDNGMASVLFRRGESEVKIHRNGGNPGNRNRSWVIFTLQLNSAETDVYVNEQGLIYIDD